MTSHKLPLRLYLLKRLMQGLLWLPLCFASAVAFAAVLPEDRIDVGYFTYAESDQDIKVPTVLVRKSVLDKLSLSAEYYVDDISGASIDVQARATEYSEERTETSLGADYLHEKTLLSVRYTATDENDFDGSSVHVDVSQDFFGDMTTLSFGYSRGNNDIGKTGDDSFEQEAKNQAYRFALSQVLSASLIANISFESITDEGYLQNPYRSVRYADASAPDGSGFFYQEENYPNTRSSDAVAFRYRYYLESNSVTYGEFRYFRDSWGIQARNFELGYVKPFGDTGWEFEIKYRNYQQTDADFFSDLYSRPDETNFRARDKELSSFSSDSYGVAIRYGIEPDDWWFVEKASATLYYDYMSFNYDNFRNVLENTGNPGEEPRYSFDASVIRLFFSVWY